MKNWKDFCISFMVTCVFVGRIRFAPGTFGSVCAFPIYFAISYLLYNDSLFIGLFIILLFFIGVILSSIYIKNLDNKDPKEVVIDEVIGQIIVIYFFDIFYTYRDDIVSLWWQYILAFLFFRFFDIYKPWPISLVDANIKSGFGIMLDDVLAAIFAIISLIVIKSFLILF